MVSGLCKGGRTPGKQSLLQAFTPLWVVLDERRDWHYVRQLDVTSMPLCLAGQNLFAGLYVNELLYHALRPQDPSVELYDTYQHTLHALTDVTEPLVVEIILRRFEWSLLAACGYQMSLTHDVRSGLSIAPENNYALIVGEGFIVADQGICGAHILALAAGKLDDPFVLKSAKRIMRRVIDHALGGRHIKSRELYR